MSDVTRAQNMQFLIIDDHALIRAALSDVLRQLQPECSIHEAGDAQTALQVLSTSTAIDLVLLDLHLPDQSGLELLTKIVDYSTTTAVVVLSAEYDQSIVRRVLETGAQGYIPKSESRDVLVKALALILAGGTYVPKIALQRSRTDNHPPGSNAGQSTPQQLGLTDRQVDVLALLMQGKNNKLICRALGLAEPTVKNHVSAILKALEVSSRTEAVLAVTRLGWTFQGRDVGPSRDG
jgi:DNA-binding NarL/FixJ family response regulator